MMAGSSALNELFLLMSEWRADESVLRQQFEGRLAELAPQMAAVQTTIDLLTRGAKGSEPEPPRPVPTNGWGKRLAGLTHMQALKVIAEENGGVVRVSEARRLLLTYGLA